MWRDQEKPEGGAQELTGRGPITWATGKDSTGTYQPLVDAWNAKHPDEKVSLSELPADADAARNQLVQNAEIKSDEFSVLGLDVTWATEFAAKRYVVELPKSQFDTGPFLPATVKSGSYRGKLYAAPAFAGADVGRHEGGLRQGARAARGEGHGLLHRTAQEVRGPHRQLLRGGP